MITAADIAALKKRKTPREVQEFIEAVASLPLPVPPLMDFIPQTTPHYVAPQHLKPLIDVLERSRREPVRILTSVPPRHAKSETLLHYIAWVLAQDPTEEIAYISHSNSVTLDKSAVARQLAIRAGVPMSRDEQAKGNWRTGRQHGGLWATSVESAITGEGFKKIIIDDPVRGIEEASSSAHRQKLYNWFISNARNRVQPGNSSIIINMARWHPDDLIGRLIKEGWEYINLPAISPETHLPLWPEMWPLDKLAEFQTNEYTWNALYQGNPTVAEGQLFRDAYYYTKLPDTYRVSIGVDCAYSESTHADFSVALVLAEYDGIYYVLDIIRKQVPIESFVDDLIKLNARYPGAHMRWDGSHQEVGTGSLIRRLGVKNFMAVPAKLKKFQRAQEVSVAWKAGRVLVPHTAPWLRDFLSELYDFTGAERTHDDQVDALASAHALLPARAAPKIITPGSPEWAQKEVQKMKEQALKEQRTSSRTRRSLASKGFL